jgi:hypothetical protein
LKNVDVVVENHSKENTQYFQVESRWTKVVLNVANVSKPLLEQNMLKEMHSPSV